MPASNYEYEINAERIVISSNEQVIASLPNTANKELLVRNLLAFARKQEGERPSQALKQLLKNIIDKKQLLSGIDVNSIGLIDTAKPRASIAYLLKLELITPATAVEFYLADKAPNKGAIIGEIAESVENGKLPKDVAGQAIKQLIDQHGYGKNQSVFHDVSPVDGDFLADLVKNKTLSSEYVVDIYYKSEAPVGNYLVMDLINRGIVTNRHVTKLMEMYLKEGFEQGHLMTAEELKMATHTLVERGLITPADAKELFTLRGSLAVAQTTAISESPRMSLTDPAEKIAGEVGREMTSKQGVTGGETPAEIKTPAERADERKVQEQRGAGEHGNKPKPKGR